MNNFLFLYNSYTQQYKTIKKSTMIFFSRVSLAVAFVILTMQLFSQNTTSNINEHKNTFSNIPLLNKTIPLNNSVYSLLDFYETKGNIGYLPVARPYSKGMIIDYLTRISATDDISIRERKIINNYLSDFTRPVNAFMIKQHQSENMYTVFGASANVGGRIGTGDNGTYSTSSIVEPFISGDLGKHISYFAGMGASIDRLAPDLFFDSYVKNREVHFPHQDIGYAFHPYQFDYETMWAHVKTSATSGEGGPLQNELTAGMIYHTEFSGSWFDNALRISLHNNRRSWGYSNNNLNLSAHARRFHGVDLLIKPNDWISYSMLVGSLFHYGNQRSGYKKNIYEYDLGNVQKMLTLHMIEFTPFKFMQFMFTGGNIWSKRMELGYVMPFVFPHFVQIDVGDHDNLSMSLNMALKFPTFGKTWFSVFVDEFSFVERENLLKMPRNRYAWQWGWNSSLLSELIPLTQTQISYTRVTPFVYTHYPESDFNTFGSERPVDMTYTHDGANLGFYLPPNSGEFRFKVTNMAIPDLKVEFDNRLIIHGTNDLAGDSLQIFGDVYRHQTGDVYDYPLLDFKNDGIYDYTWYSQIRAEYRIRKGRGLDYYRVFGSLGYSTTWWEENDSGVIAPPGHDLFSVEFGLSVDF
ncbi:MAG: hypothetical protein PF486_00295 [Prolixibacteraceae bacterium]|jgi:hypothetical protein|nr:hypothetical protein [Prolixibacteraceae bacterium]